jgi:hypothetical protein
VLFVAVVCRVPVRAAKVWGAGGYAGPWRAGVNPPTTDKTKKTSKNIQKYLDFSYILRYDRANERRCAQMKANEAIREVMKATGTKVSDLAFRTNKKSNVISERLSQENISIKLMNEMLRAMGYKVVAVPRETRIPEGGFEVE